MRSNLVRMIAISMIFTIGFGCQAGPAGGGKDSAKAPTGSSASGAPKAREVPRGPIVAKGSPFAESVLGPLSLTLAWETPPLGEKIVGLELASHSVYAVTDKHYLYAFDRKTGITKWSENTRGSLVVPPGASGSTSFYIVDDILNALDIRKGARTGRESGLKRWRRSLPFSPSTAPVANEFYAYLGSYDRRIYCLDDKSGNILWSYDTNGEIRIPPTLTDRRVYVTSEDGEVYAFELGSGDMAPGWPFHTYGKVRGFITVDQDVDEREVQGKKEFVKLEDVVYIGSLDTTLYAVSGGGQLKCKFAAGMSVTDTPWVVQIPDPKDPSALGTTQVYLRCGKNRMFALEVDKRVKLIPELRVPGAKAELEQHPELIPLVHTAFWKWEFVKLWERDGYLQFLAKGKDLVYFLKGNKILAAVEAKTGEIRWELSLPQISFFLSNPVDDVLYLGDAQGKVYAVTEMRF